MVKIQLRILSGTLILTHRRGKARAAQGIACTSLPYPCPGPRVQTPVRSVGGH